MCGIWAYIGKIDTATATACLRALLARGPDGGRLMRCSQTLTMGFTRLAINGLTTAGMQPFQHGQTYTICNGEIYNYKALGEEFGLVLTTGSDCEVIGSLVAKFGVRTPQLFDGVFASVVYHEGVTYVMRDPYGVRPLYVADVSGGIAFASEMKGLIPLNPTNIRHFPPGHVATYNATGVCTSMTRFHAVPWLKNPALADETEARKHVRIALTAAVRKRMMSDRPIGCLLSGGLDSSLVAALVARCSPKPIHTFSIGMPGSTDLRYARIVAKHIGSYHHEIVVSEEDFFKAIPETVAAIESYDITSVRASVGNYLVAKYIRQKTDVKVVFNGDGSDEASGSYLYFYNAPTETEFEFEVGRLLEDIHAFDVLRSDRSIAAHGLEARTPFLDRQFVATYLSIDTRLRQPRRGSRVEKQLLREAFDPRFDCPGEPLLPHEVLWRTKEAFSDGVSSTERSWYQVINENITKETDAGYSKYKFNKPYTPESLWYRELFDIKYHCGEKTIPYFWLPRWSGDAKDPSARTLKVYADVSTSINANGSP